MDIKLFTAIIAVLVLFFIIVYTLYSGKNCKSCEKYEGIPVWAYWEPNPPPKKVKKCYNNWKEVGKLHNINLLNPDNITKYIPEDEYKKICKNADNLAVKSDFIGLYLLSTYGGIWIDSTVFLNKPLLDWLPTNKMFTYNADRFNDITTCMETFFMYSPKDNIIAKKWYKLLHEIQETEGKNNFIERVIEEYPNIANAMDANYLWVYVAGKYLLIKNPYLKEHLNYKSAEEGPWYACEKYGWDNIEQICDDLKNKKPCEVCEMTKLHRDLRENCDDDVIP